MKRIIITTLLITASIILSAQSELLPKGLTVEQYSDEFLDSLNVKKDLKINDYSMFGISYGANLSKVMWNPAQKQESVIIPMNIGISYTKYGKMFGYMPFFGFQIGLNYTKEGYQFEYNEDRDYTYKIEGAEKAIYDVLEMPLYMHCHYDLWNFKIIAHAGCYAGYRIGIHRYPGKTGNVKPEVENSFVPTDRRWDYGLKGGAGFGLVFDPIEIHLMVIYKHSFGSLYDPDHYSEYYYRFAYPMNITVSAGVHIHLSKRTGKTKAALRKEARDLVYGNNKTEE
ncbi:MAG: outer membrane beta-barrel protein [Bacteroidales bacterium]|nr:outer membrane beta-barrel protein [Bacteroidales bacterium]